MNPLALLMIARAGAGPIALAGNRLSSLGLGNGDAFTVPAGQTWISDLSVSPALVGLTINGTLTPDITKNTQLTVDSIAVGSTGFYNGTAVPAAFTAAVQLKGGVPVGRILGPTHNSSNVSYGTPNDGGGTSRGIIIQDGGRFEMRGYDPGIVNTTLYDTHVAATNTTIRVAGVVNWKAGWSFTLGMTKFLQSLSQADCTEVLTLASDSVVDASNLFTTLTTTTGALYTHYGKLQYGTGAGMSLTNDGYTASNIAGHIPTQGLAGGALTAMYTAYAAEITTAIAAGRKNILDQRAPVSLLTRNATISAPNDTAFSGNEKFGVHIMKMGLTGSLILDNVEIVRCGQGGALGRYPVHWHMNSIDPATGAILGLVTAGSNIVNKCSIHQSHNRGITFHGVHGATASNNVIHDVVGHAIFLEDGSEKFNTIDGNFVTHWRAPDTVAIGSSLYSTDFTRGYQIKIHDAKTAGLWCTNVNNTIKNNRFSDGNIGMWINQANTCVGLSALCSITPYYEPVLLWDNNTAHCTYKHASRALGGVTDEQGNAISPTQSVNSTNTGHPGGSLIASAFTNETLWKGNGSNTTDDEGNQGQATGNYQNVVSKPNYTGWVVADALGQDFSGNTNADPTLQFSKQHLFVGTSLNSETIQSTTVIPRNAFASYHGSIPFLENTFINYLPRTPRYNASAHYTVIEADGVMSSWDLYIDPLEGLGIANTNNHYIDALPTWKTPGPGMVRKTTTYSAYQTAAQVGSSVGGGWNSMALIDYDGRIGGLGRAKAFMILDHPFVTTGISDLYTPDEKGVSSYQKITQTPVYGFEVWRMAGLYGGSYPSTGTNPNPYRTSANNADDRYAGAIKYFRADPTTLVDIGASAVADFDYSRTNLGGQMAAVPRGGAVRVSTAAYNETGTSGAATTFSVTLYGMMRTTAGSWAADDFLYIGIDWPGGTAPTEVFLKIGTSRNAQGYVPEMIDPVASKAALLALTGSGKANMGYWRDTANNMIWARVCWNPSAFGTPTDTAANWAPNQNALTFGVSP